MVVHAVPQHYPDSSDKQTFRALVHRKQRRFFNADVPVIVRTL
jgi:hypothetical protein